MTVKDLTIGSPVYRVGLDAIEISHVRLIEAFENGELVIELNAPWKPKFRAEKERTELVESYKTIWYINLEDAELAQLMRRSEIVEKLKKEMEFAQNRFAEAIQKYAFSEPSTPNEL